MNRRTLAIVAAIVIAAAALLILPLAACDKKAENISTQAPDPQAAELAKAPPVAKAARPHVG